MIAPWFWACALRHEFPSPSLVGQEKLHGAAGEGAGGGLPVAPTGAIKARASETGTKSCFQLGMMISCKVCERRVKGRRVATGFVRKKEGRSNIVGISGGGRHPEGCVAPVHAPQTRNRGKLTRFRSRSWLLAWPQRSSHHLLDGSST